MIPGLIIAIKMGLKLGPISNDPSALGQQIGQTISGIYQNSHWLTIGFIVVTALLIFWRARKLSKSTGDRGLFNGLLVAVFPVLIISLFIYSSGFDVTSVVEILGFLAAGYAGGYVSR